MSATTSPPAADVNQNSVLVPILMIVLAVALFSCGDTLAKLLRESALPSAEIAWLRYITFVIYAVVLAVRSGTLRVWPRRPKLQVLRGLCAVGSSVVFIVALGRLPIADATAITSSHPPSSPGCRSCSCASRWA